MTQRKKKALSTKYDVGLVSKPWWNQALIQTFLGGIFLLIGAGATVYFSKERPSFDQNVIENSNISYIDINLARFRFNSENNNLFDVMLPVHVNGASNVSIYFNRGNGYEIIASSKEKSDFPIVISHLQCDATYFFRIDPVLDGKSLRGAVSHFSLPRCKTPDERKALLKDIHYTDSFYMPSLIGQN